MLLTKPLTKLFTKLSAKTLSQNSQLKYLAGTLSQNTLPNQFAKTGCALLTPAMGYLLPAVLLPACANRLPRTESQHTE